MKPFRYAHIPILIQSLWLLWGCGQEAAPEDPLAAILQSSDPAIARVMADPGKYELQIRYTQIRREGDSVRFDAFDYRVDPKSYYYPASTVKFPVAVLALEKLATIDSIDRDTRYYIEGDSVEQSFADDLVQIFAVSDNHANNRLFEFLGQDAINDSLAARGVGPARLAHRLGYHRDDTSTQPLVYYRNDSTTFQSGPLANRPPQRLDLPGITKGSGYMSEDSLVARPFDFGLKNYLPLTSLDGILKRVIFPEAFPEHERFRLSPEQLDFLRYAMQITPREAGYDPEIYPDGYCKFFIFGDGQVRIPQELQIFNKVGFAYGTLTDGAYIRDSRYGVEFFLCATLLVNENGVFNDDQYEYDEVGIPFLAALGRAVYEYEKQR